MNYDHLFDYLTKNNILIVVSAALLSYKLNDVSNELFDGIIVPIINSESDKKFEDYKVTVFSTTFKIGKVCLALLKFFIILYLIYLLSVIIHVSDHL